MADNKKNLDDLNKGAEKLNQSSKDRSKFLEKENYLLKEQLKLQSESLDLSSSLVDSIKEVLGISTKRSTADANLLKVNKEINKTILNQERGLTSIDQIQKEQIKNNKVIEKGKKVEASLENTLGKKLTDRANIAVKYYTKAQEAQKAREEELKKAEAGEEIDQNRLQSLADTEASFSAIADNILDGAGNLEKQLIFTKLNNQELGNQQKILDDNKNLIKKYNKGFAGAVNIAAGLDKGLEKVLGFNLGINEAVEKTKKEYIESGGLIKKNSRLAKNLGASFNKTFKAGAIVVFLAAIKGSFDQILNLSGEVAKNFGISNKEAVKLNKHSREVANNMSNGSVFSKDIIKAQMKLNSIVGTSVIFSDKLSTEFALISKRAGLSEEAMKGLGKAAIKGKKGPKDILKTINKTVLIQSEQEGIMFNQKEIQEKVLKISSDIKLSTKGNKEEMVKTVIAAKKLGTTMDGVKKIASSLLDFESSIQAELEAELLLGKQINLEQARLAALKGDYKTVAEEVLKNEAIMEAFNTKNVMAQEAAAKAIGVGRDELSDMISQQQALEAVKKQGFESVSDAQIRYNELRKEGLSAEEAALKVGDASLQNQLESASAADRWKDIISSLSDAFMPILEDILPPIADFLGSIASTIQFISGLGKAIGDFLFGWLKPLMKAMPILGKIVKVVKGLAYIAVLVAAYKAFQSLAAIPVAGAVLGAAAATAITALGFGLISAIPTGDMSSEADGKTQVSTKEGGLFELSDNDDFVAAPGAVKTMKDSINSKNNINSSPQDNSQLIAKIDQLIKINTRIAQVSGNRKQDKITLEMMGDKVGGGIQNETYDQA
jgi:hypothetical protein